jgi:hypothetical protein
MNMDNPIVEDRTTLADLLVNDERTALTAYLPHKQLSDLKPISGDILAVRAGTEEDRHLLLLVRAVRAGGIVECGAGGYVPKDEKLSRDNYVPISGVRKLRPRHQPFERVPYAQCLA